MVLLGSNEPDSRWRWIRNTPEATRLRKICLIGYAVAGPSSGVEKVIATGEFDVMYIHYNLMYQSTYDSFGGCGVIPDAEVRGMRIVLRRLTTRGYSPNSCDNVFRRRWKESIWKFYVELRTFQPKSWQSYAEPVER